MTSRASKSPGEFNNSEDVLPEGWCMAKLGEISVAPQYGWTTSADKSRQRGLKLLRTSDISNGDVDWTSVPFCEEEPDAPQKYLLRPGDILVSRAGSVGLSYLVKKAPRAIFASYLIRFHAVPPIGSQFVGLFLKSPDYWSAIAQNTLGIAVPNVNASKLSELNVPVPPLLEQTRIVSKVEALLAHIDSARERLVRIPVLLKCFRQAVLAAACSGKLTEDWRARNPDSETVPEMIKRIRKRRETTANSVGQTEKLRQIYGHVEENDSDELPENWRFVALNKLCASFDYGTSKKSQPSGRVPVLRMGNIQNGEIDWSNLAYTSDANEIKKYLLQPNTVLFNRTNSPELVGKTAIYRDARPAIFAGYLIRIVHFPELDPHFLNLCLNTNYAREFCSRVKTDGVSQSNINAQKVGTFEVPYCSLKEQREIVRRANALLQLADSIDKRLTSATVRTDKLVESVLAKAFRGELVPTEAELARHEGREYEPASVLLKRIREQRLSRDVFHKRAKRRGTTASAHS